MLVDELYNLMHAQAIEEPKPQPSRRSMGHIGFGRRTPHRPRGNLLIPLPLVKASNGPILMATVVAVLPQHRAPAVPSPLRPTFSSPHDASPWQPHSGKPTSPPETELKTPKAEPKSDRNIFGWSNRVFSLYRKKSALEHRNSFFDEVGSPGASCRDESVSAPIFSEESKLDLTTDQSLQNTSVSVLRVMSPGSLQYDPMYPVLNVSRASSDPAGPTEAASAPNVFEPATAAKGGGGSTMPPRSARTGGSKESSVDYLLDFSSPNLGDHLELSLSREEEKLYKSSWAENGFFDAVCYKNHLDAEVAQSLEESRKKKGGSHRTSPSPFDVDVSNIAPYDEGRVMSPLVEKSSMAPKTPTSRKFLGPFSAGRTILSDILNRQGP